MRICVFCGSSPGNDLAYADAARSVGQGLADNGCDLVYGGGRAGLMGVVADAVLAAGGKVTGVIPRALVNQEIAHSGLTQLLVVPTMHERKAKMADLADGFIALPGGVGTLEEIFEQWGWARLGIHGKPCAFFDVKGFFEPVRTMLNQMLRAGFMRKEHTDIITFASDLGQILEAFRSYEPPSSRWFPPKVVGKSKDSR
ncbi:MAG: TIGR00730 family Rossman fold protein [Chthoniobacterales bacterium]